MQADLYDTVHQKIERWLAELLVQVEPKLHQKFLSVKMEDQQ